MTGDNPSDERKKRLAVNEAIFRELNEQLEQLSGPSTTAREFKCECPDITCEQMVPLAIAEYEEVRSVSTRFFVAPRHERPEVERVVAETERYKVVEKVGVAAEVAAKSDPRA